MHVGKKLKIVAQLSQAWVPGSVFRQTYLQQATSVTSGWGPATDSSQTLLNMVLSFSQHSLPHLGNVVVLAFFPPL
jgi:hypothetical protein